MLETGDSNQQRSGLATVEAAQHPEPSTCEKTGTDPTPSAGKPKAALFYQHLTIQLFK